MTLAEALFPSRHISSLAVSTFGAPAAVNTTGINCPKSSSEEWDTRVCNQRYAFEGIDRVTSTSIRELPWAV